MAVVISTPETAWTSQEIALGGIIYDFTYTYNKRDQRWRLTISLDDTIIIAGVKIIENQSLFSRYILPNFNHGDIYCIRFKEDGKDVGLNNLGVDKAYSLVYFSNEELSALGV